MKQTRKFRYLVILPSCPALRYVNQRKHRQHMFETAALSRHTVRRPACSGHAARPGTGFRERVSARLFPRRRRAYGGRGTRRLPRRRSQMSRHDLANQVVRETKLLSIPQGVLVVAREPRLQAEQRVGRRRPRRRTARRDSLEAWRHRDREASSHEGLFASSRRAAA